MAQCPSCPFTAGNQLCDDFDAQHRTQSLPGHPLVRLEDIAQLGNFLDSDLCCEDLETMAPYLWMMSTWSSSNIRPLHRHKLLGREILITESPRLHLVWYEDRVFVKPLPKYLLSHNFWTTYLTDETGILGTRVPDIKRAALGYIRTYRYLIKHESDFDLAQSHNLIPSKVTWPQFCAFISSFDCILDDHVSGRYQYGELRLSRLNFYCMFFLRRFHFEYLPMQYSAYFSRYFGPLLFAFAVLSLLLGAMQVEINVQEMTGSGLGSTLMVYRWFSIIIMLVGLGISVFLSCYVLYMIANEWVFALRFRRKRLLSEIQAQS